MRLCVINSLLVVCFYNGLKSYQVSQFFYKICGKIVRNVYKSTFMEYCVKSTINTRGILPIFINYFFRTVRSTKHLVDRVSADYIGFYMQGSGKSDKYGFSVACLSGLFMRLDVFFKFFHKIYHFKLFFTLKLYFLMEIMFRQV